MSTRSAHVPDPAGFLPARIARASVLPWVPSATPGKASRPLRFLSGNRGFVEVLRMQPGVVMPLHRHSGEIHAWNFGGWRTLCTGEEIGPGDYVYEPPGNVDWWKVSGDETLDVLVVVMGMVEFLAADGAVVARADATSQRAAYLEHCVAHGIAPLDLDES